MRLPWPASGVPCQSAMRLGWLQEPGLFQLHTAQLMRSAAMPIGALR